MMKNKFLHFFKTSDNFLLVPFLISLFIAFLIVSLIFIFYNQLPLKLPLFYSLPWGENQLISKQQFFLLPIVLLLIILVNTFIVSQLHHLQKVLKRLLMFGLIFIDLVILTTFFKILFIFL